MSFSTTRTFVPSLKSSCLICNSEFLRKSIRHPNQKFCSSKCIKTNYRRTNTERDKEAKAAWIVRNPEKRKAASEKYRKENSEYYTQYSSLRTRKQLQAKPKCLTEFDNMFLIEFYDLAKRRGLEVDHIIPLQHKLVCGLHVPENLQMLTRSQNAKKSNKFDEDVVAVIKE